jgi:hypothetical protein
MAWLSEVVRLQKNPQLCYVSSWVCLADLQSSKKMLAFCFSGKFK